MQTGQKINSNYIMVEKSTDFYKTIGRLGLPCQFIGLGIKPSHFTGLFSPERIQELIKFCQKNNKYHIISSQNSMVYNSYRSGADMYYLGNGDKNPLLAFDFGPITLAEILTIAEFYKR